MLTGGSCSSRPLTETLAQETVGPANWAGPYIPWARPSQTTWIGWVTTVGKAALAEVFSA